LGLGMKICPICEKYKPNSDFYLDKKTRDGLFMWCKECHKEYGRMMYRYWYPRPNEKELSKSRREKYSGKAIKNLKEKTAERKKSQKTSDFSICSQCKKKKPASDFHKTWRNKSGLSSWCKECTRKKR
jgi:hypothetical protein